MSQNEYKLPTLGLRKEECGVRIENWDGLQGWEAAVLREPELLGVGV